MAGGLNTFSTLDVPVANPAEGAILDTSGVVAEKTVYISGSWSGSFEVLGSHNGRFVPILKFESDGRGGPQTIRRDIKLTLKSMRVRRNAIGNVNLMIAAQAICAC